MNQTKENTINIVINMDNEVELALGKQGGPKHKITVDDDGFAPSIVPQACDSCIEDIPPEHNYPEDPASSPCVVDISNTPIQPTSQTHPDIPEEERIVDDSDVVMYKVIEMCKQFGIKNVLESLRSLVENHELSEKGMERVMFITNTLYKKLKNM